MERIEWNRQQKRIYKRVRQGFASHPGKRLSFLTLTSPGGNEQKQPLEKSLNLLIKRIRHKYGEFEYFAVQTTEGNGVYHIIFHGPYIPQKWLSDTWQKIRGAWSVDIRSVGTVKSKYRLGRYIVQAYISGQNFVVRSSMSRGWLSKPVTKIKEFERFMRKVLGIRYWIKDYELYEYVDKYLGGELYGTVQTELV